MTRSGLSRLAWLTHGALPACGLATLSLAASPFPWPVDTNRTVLASQRAVIAMLPDGALRVTATGKAKRAGIELRAPSEGWDLSAYSALEVHVQNLSTQAVPVRVRVDDSSPFRLDGGSVTTVQIPADGEGFARVPLNDRLFRVASPPTNLIGLAAPRHPALRIDPSRISRVLVHAEGADESVSFEVTGIRAVGNVRHVAAESFRPFIDRFGQFAHAEWPGRLGSTREFAARIKAEETDLRRHPTPRGRDRWGGSIGRPPLKATGWFRTETVDGKWWLVDPDGNLFWSLGVCSVSPSSPTPISDRRDYFQWLPAEEEPWKRFFTIRSGAPVGFYRGMPSYVLFDFAGANLFRKYGEEWPTKWIDVTLQRLPSWGFNTIGNWSAVAACAARKVPYTALVGFWPKSIVSSTGYHGKFPDPFDASFRSTLQKSLKAHVDAGTAGDPWCIGFFVQSELGWGDDASLGVAALCSPASQAAKRVVVQRFRDKYRSIETLNGTWGSKYVAWDDIVVQTNAPDVRRAREDLKMANSIIAEEYFRVVHDELQRMAPNHLYLGCPFAWANETALRVAAKYCDVVTVNRYSDSVEKYALPEGISRPVMIGEFHFGALDRGLFNTGLRSAASQADRAAKFRRYVESALKNPCMVGAHWFQYRDQMASGRFDGENYQAGLVDICDTPYPEMVSASRDIGARCYELRMSMGAGADPEAAR